MKNVILITVVLGVLYSIIGCKKQFGITSLVGKWYLRSCIINGIDSTDRIKSDTNYAFIAMDFAAADDRQSGPIFLACYSSTKKLIDNGNQATASNYKVKTLHWCWCNSAIFQNKQEPCNDWIIKDLTNTTLELELDLNNKKTVIKFNKNSK